MRLPNWMKEQDPETREILLRRATRLGLTLEELRERDRAQVPSYLAAEMLAERRGTTAEALLEEALEHARNFPYPTPACPLPMDLAAVARGELRAWEGLEEHRADCPFCARIFESEVRWQQGGS